MAGQVDNKAFKCTNTLAHFFLNTVCHIHSKTQQLHNSAPNSMASVKVALV